jgi:hypothetical protein
MPARVGVHRVPNGVAGGIDQRDSAIRLREIAKFAVCEWVVLLGRGPTWLPTLSSRGWSP